MRTSIFQNRFVLGFMSLMVMATAFAFVLSPTKVSAQASIESHREKDGMVVFGTVTKTNGDPQPGVSMELGARKEGDHQNKTKIFDRATSDSRGRYKLWVSHNEVKKLEGRKLVFILKPDGQTRYEQFLRMRAGNVAAIYIQMRTPVIPVFPFTVFVY